MLPVGTRIGEFEISALIGEGGFGIVYLAFDHALERQVALKEYMPASLAFRERDASVVVRSSRDQDTFQAGLRSFVNEARLLAQFDHPALVKVHRFWEGNGTAYMVMPLYEGITLKDALKKMGQPPDEEWLTTLMGPLLDALSFIHARQCFHRDIAPDNIMILNEGGPVLLDFGAARRVIGDMTQVLTVILKPGYAPVEQYADVAGMKQGAWTDLYALAAVIYFAATGRTPMPSVARLVTDGLTPLSQAAQGRYSPVFLAGIDRALSLKPEHRPQSVAEFRMAIGMLDPGDRNPTLAPTIVPLAPAMEIHDAFAETIPMALSTQALAAGHFGRRPTPAAIPAPAAAAEAVPSTGATPVGPLAPVVPSGPGPGRKFQMLLIGAVVVVLALAALVFGLMSGGRRPAPTAPTGESPVPAAPAASVSVVPPPAVSVPTPAASPSPAAVTTTPQAAPTPAPAAPGPVPQAAAPTTSPVAPPVAPAVTPSVAPAAVAVEPVPEAHALEPRPPVRPRPAAPVHPHPPPVSPTAPSADASPRIGADPSQCADLLQRASLGEPLTADEKALLRRSCR